MWQLDTLTRELYVKSYLYSNIFANIFWSLLFLGHMQGTEIFHEFVTSVIISYPQFWSVTHVYTHTFSLITTVILKFLYGFNACHTKLYFLSSHTQTVICTHTYTFILVLECVHDLIFNMDSYQSKYQCYNSVLQTFVNQGISYFMLSMRS